MTAARASDDGHWIHFRVARPSLDSLLEDERARLGVFLTRAAPSKVKTSDGVGWISIVHERAASDEERDDDKTEEWEVTEGQKESMLRDWNSCGEITDCCLLHRLPPAQRLQRGPGWRNSDKEDWGGETQLSKT